MLKLSSRTRGLSLRALAAAAAMVFLCGDGGAPSCTSPPPPQDDARLTATVSRPTGTYQPGDKVTLQVTVRNDGTRQVDDVRVTTTLDYNLQFTSATCTGFEPLPPDMGSDPGCSPRTRFRHLPVGATATVAVVATVLSAETAVASNHVVVEVSTGPAYPLEAPVALANRPGDGYRAYTAAGQSLDAHVDFERSTLTLGTVTLPFGPVDASGTRRLPAGAAWREAPDLLVGTADLGDGVQPFIAARRFVTSLAELQGRSLALIEVETAGGHAVSRVRPVAVDANSMLHMCLESAASLAACPPASLRWIPVSAYGGVFSGSNALTNESMRFRIARSGDTLVLLGAEPTDTGRVFQIGLPTANGIAAGNFEGGDNRARWGTLSFAPASASLHEALVRADGSPLAIDGRLSAIADGPGGLTVGTLGDAAAAVWLAQDGPLAVAIGQPGSGVDGLLQLFAR
jgi:uncharacterized repeat protein (TIGR01451 family)